MATILQELQKIKQSVGAEISDVASGVGAKFNSIVGTVSAKVGGVLNGDVVGIDANQIPAMKAAIKTYVDGIEEHLEQVKKDTVTDQAYKGDYAEAVTEFIAAVCNACDCITSQLLRFSDQLTEIEEAYRANDTQMAQNLRNNASDIQQAHTKYETQS